MSLRKLLTTEHPTFKAIFDAAAAYDKAEDQATRDANEKKLIEIAERGILLDARYGYLSPVMLLANEGYFKAIDLLMNKFHVKISDAVFGFAALGETQRVDALIKANPTYNHELRSWAVQGYAFAGNHNEVNAQLVAFASRSYAVKGYASAGNKADAKRLITDLVERNEGTFGFAVGGFEECVNELIVEGAAHWYALVGYACNGHVQLADKMLAINKDHDDVALAYARSFNKEQVVKQQAAGASNDSILYGYLIHGHLIEANKFVTQKISFAAAVEKLKIHQFLKKERIFQLIALIEHPTLIEHMIKKIKYQFLDIMNCMQAFSLYALVYPDTKKYNLQYTEKNFVHVLMQLCEKNSAKKYVIASSVRRGELFRAINTLPKETRDEIQRRCLDETSALGKRFHQKDLAVASAHDTKFRKMILDELKIADPNPTADFSLRTISSYLWEPKKSVTAATIEADDNLNEDKTDGYYPL